MALKLYYGNDPGKNVTSVKLVPMFTDNRSNGSGESNREADALANGCADGFNPELDLKVDYENLQWSILPKALEVGKQAEEAYRTAKEGGHLPIRAKKERKKRLEDRLRTKDPW